jgi:hypothetical protein
MQREKVTIRPGQTQVVRLDRDSSTPAPVHGDSPQQYMRILDKDTRILFADEDLEAAIIASGAKKGEVIQISRRPNGAWEVGILPSQHAPQNGGRPASAQAAQTYQQWADEPAQQPASNGNGHTNQANLPGPDSITQACIKPFVAFETALLTARHATKFAASLGLELRFDTGDIRALAISLLIQAEKGAR